MSAQSDMRGPRSAMHRSRLNALLSFALRSLVILASTLYCGGFLVYLAEYQRAAEPSFDKADAIIVLTGGPERIAEAAKLLAEHHAKRLLISGVNEQTDADDLVRIVPLLSSYMKCCVTIDQTAQNTHENAVSSLAWIKQNKVGSILLVTSHAHLPRALFEFRTMTDGTLQIAPWRVGGPQHAEDWWHDGATIRGMLVEYTKLVGAVIRYGFGSLKSGTEHALGFAA